MTTTKESMVETLPESIPAEKRETVSEDLIRKYMSSFGIASGLDENEQGQFVEIAKAYQLNPFKREIYCVPYMANVKDANDKWTKEKKLSIITGYEVYLKRGERTGKLNGYNCITEGEGDKLKAIITIHRKDWQHPFKHEVYWSEVAQLDGNGKPRALWAKMPKFMIKKVCLAQGFRLCFPDEFGGMPYTADELPENMTQIITEKPVDALGEKLLEEGSEQQRPSARKRRALAIINNSTSLKALDACSKEFLSIAQVVSAEDRAELGAKYAAKKKSLEVEK